MSENGQIVAPGREKPLNQSQLKNLQQLVDGDFRDLRLEIHNEIHKRLTKRIEEIEAKHNATELDKARKKLVEEQRKAEDRLQKLVDGFKDKGIAVCSNRYSKVFEVSVDVTTLRQQGKDDEVAQAEQAADRLKAQADRVLGREERQIQRMVLLQGISATAAMEIIDDLPERQDVMDLVAIELKAEAEADMLALAPEIERAEIEG